MALGDFDSQVEILAVDSLDALLLNRKLDPFDFVEEGDVDTEGG